MKISITLQNYRCFPEPSKAEFTIKAGIIAFVGPNNAGKSSLLKFFYEFRELFQKLSASQNVLGPQKTFTANEYGFPPEVANYSQLLSNENNEEMRIKIKIESDAKPRPIPQDFILNHRRNLAGSLLVDMAEISISRNAHASLKTMISNGAQWSQAFGGVSLYDTNQFQWMGDTAPLKEAFRILSNSLYVGPFRNLLALDGNGQQYYDLPTGIQFIHEWSQAQAGTSTQKNDATVAMNSDIEKIFEYESFNMAALPNPPNLQVYINKKGYPLTQVGSGLSQFIITLFAAAKKEPDLILIDEPEMNLHPRLQIDFLTSLAKYSKYATLCSTHNIGLARSTASAIYSISREKKGRFSNVHEFDKAGNLPELLGELSYSGSYDIGYRFILLVEGPTEILIFQQLLRKQGIDHKVTILPLGGSSLINGNNESKRALAEIVRMANSTKYVWTIVDSERESEEHKPIEGVRKFLDVCKRLKIKAKALDRRSIECYINDAAAKKIAGNAVTAPGHFEKFSDRWNKSLNWRMIQEMEWEDLEKTDLGQFIMDFKKAIEEDS